MSAPTGFAAMSHESHGLCWCGIGSHCSGGWHCDGECPAPTSPDSDPTTEGVPGE